MTQTPSHPPEWRRKGKRWPWLLATALLIVVAWLALEYARLPDPSPLREKNPESTALIDQREEEARTKGRAFRKRQYWIRLANVPKHVLDAVLLSEDAAFFQHDGVDRAEMKKALVDAWEKGQLGRGASTLTMQLAKNLWLSTDRSLVRKLKELILTQRLEDTLSKKRILTLYLNVAEWGEGVFGVEAAARAHFGVSASNLTPAQAAVLATMLPAPRTWSPAKKSRQLHRRSLRLISRMKSAGRLSVAEADAAKLQIERMFSGAGAADQTEDAEADGPVGPSHLDSEEDELEQRPPEENAEAVEPVGDEAAPELAPEPEPGAEPVSESEPEPLPEAPPETPAEEPAEPSPAPGGDGDELSAPSQQAPLGSAPPHRETPRASRT